MTPLIETREYSLPPVSLPEVLRYSGCPDAAPDIEALAKECLAESEKLFCPKVCFGEFPVNREGDALDFGFVRITSKGLTKNLENCNSAVIFAATVGIEIDRLIKRYGYTSPARAVMLQAVGAERIEALCDVFCADIEREAQKNGFTIRPRFSPGYGDLKIELQADIFRVLDCPRKIGATLNSSLLVSPTKSVTAFIGLSKQA